MSKILVTGGLGFIGSHTIVDLFEHNFEVVSIDNLSNSTPFIQEGINKITGKQFENYNIDLRDFDATKAVFDAHPDISGVIHFAAFKAVGESVEKPLDYFDNNITGLINLLKCVKAYGIKNFVFSSSCTVYGSPDEMPVHEESKTKPAESPYGATKQMGERILFDVAKTIGCRVVLLRYFNPVGAHPSALIGELPLGKPLNLVPVITQTAVGKYPQMHVYGDDYNTKDGSCIRDYIHVCDVASAHTLALEYILNGKQIQDVEVFNLGSGVGSTVLEAIKAFESVSSLSLNYKIAPRRDGDVAMIYADNSKAKKMLGWEIKFDLTQMMKTAWDWQLKVQELELDMMKK